MYRIKTILRNSPLVIAILYFLVGGLWVQFSDQFVLASFNEPETITQVQSLKGWLFVLASGVMIYLLVWKNNTLLSKAIQQLRKSRDEFKATFESAPVGIAHHKPDENWIQVNQTLCDMLGYKKEELLNLNFEDFIHPDDIEASRELDQELVEQKRTSYKIEKRYRTKDGTYFPGLVSKSAVFNGPKNPVYLVVMLENIADQKKTEEKLQQSVEAKETLLSEIHHRVRNNLALVSALFDLQAMYTENERVHAILHDSQMRVKCLALVHESYADAEKTSHIDFGDYLNQLVDFIYKTFKKENGESTVNIKKDIPTVNLNINQAVPAGLLCNELLLNAYLNSYEDIKNPAIEVSLKEVEESVVLTVSDNGLKSSQEYNLKKPTSLGMLIVKTLNSQLRGNISVTEQNDKTSFELTFEKRDFKGPSSAL
ncbi:MAG: PAS domain S-box protein [Gracilimonas sp.]|uniref:sensor histidine kinase n=1 Tax=Gracilimonas sp. TaxID=1974203 RepID=UPI001995255F|nr:PAS domain S-box protein [Gracilimonas sp.]MBD3616567.1 PAS domain S-box protein [Gracilimonas sp.]